ncbi:uncharacterized protein AMSG_09440 [Thecamonas trahens ATCC 50062]|uniref:PX domain-containing protein n=1 Tax=Thecamonas trahens ATCC 50062 TaxID=461836 RepID=A0A0L0DQL8_THETB|nr:hypothetical protein AMSG_09440 [Thecamonas trahens ATCC 50062]KNC53728.1 hypothetical protein AMSG_09440 [Thecamonas trahens ATCC 50062]|eukprot:XP_013754292.1 hypothetical protein AMSG_09440 [Thecamonas trahens ATCC 50062]
MPTASEYLVLAARKGAASKIGALAARGADVDFVDDRGLTPLLHALARRDGETTEAVCMAGADTELISPSAISPLILALLSGELTLVDIVLSYGAEPNRVCEQLVAPLRLDRIEIWLPLHLAIALERPDFVELLLLAGASVDEVMDKVGEPLHLAAAAGSVACAQILLDAGAESSRGAPVTGATPLHLAGTIGGNVGVLALLKNAGADFQALDASGKTPLAAASAAPPGSVPSDVIRFLTNYTKVSLNKHLTAATETTVDTARPRSAEVLNYPAAGSAPALLLGSILGDIDEERALPVLTQAGISDELLNYATTPRADLEARLRGTGALSSVALARFLAEVDAYNAKSDAAAAAAAAAASPPSTPTLPVPRGRRSNSVSKDAGSPLAAPLMAPGEATITMAAVASGGKFKRQTTYVVTLRPPGIAVERRYKDFAWLATRLRNIYPFRSVPGLPPPSRQTGADATDATRRQLLIFLRHIHARPDVYDPALLKPFLLLSTASEWDAHKRSASKHPPPPEAESHLHGRDAAAHIRPDADAYLTALHASISAFALRGDARGGGGAATSPATGSSVHAELRAELDAMMDAASGVLEYALASDVECVTAAVSQLAGSARKALKIGKTAVDARDSPVGLRDALKGISLHLVAVLNVVPRVSASPGGLDDLMDLNSCTHALTGAVERLLSLLALTASNSSNAPSRNMVALSAYAETHGALGAMHTRQAAVESAVLLDTMYEVISVARSLLVAFDNRSVVATKFDSSQKKTLAAQLKLRTARDKASSPSDSTVAKLEALARHNQAKLEQRRTELSFATYALLEDTHYVRDVLISKLTHALAHLAFSTSSFNSQVAAVWLRAHADLAAIDAELHAAGTAPASAVDLEHGSSAADSTMPPRRTRARSATLA